MDTHFLKFLKCLIYLGYWKTKHYKCLVSEKDAKANKFGGTKGCKTEEERKYFVNSKTENENFG